MFAMEEIIRQMSGNAQAIRALVQTLSDGAARWKPNPETWCMQEVMDHVYNEERIDFRKHLKEMLSDPPQPWGEFHPEEYISVKDHRQALEGFLTEREASINWLKSLGSQDWEVASRTPFTHEGREVVLRAGDVLASWVEHDHLHLRQMNELLHAWNEHRAAPYSVQYGGGW
jgi:hypothetical protein